MDLKVANLDIVDKLFIFTKILQNLLFGYMISLNDFNNIKIIVE